MKVSQRGFTGTGFAVVFIFLLLWCSSGLAQTNSWIGSGSGDWESPEWSLGLPATNEDIYITNAGSKVIVIEPTTAQNYPQSLDIQSLVLSSPSNTVNALLMNDVGLENPLVIGSGLTIGNWETGDTNSLFQMFSSALLANGDIYLSGNFDERDSLVVAQSLRVDGAGTFSNSLVIASNAEAFSWGQIEQYGGTNETPLVSVGASAAYTLFDGVVKGQVEINDSTALFVQNGGLVTGGIYFNGGQDFTSGGIYTLNEGIVYCTNLIIPNWGGSLVQNGGTNLIGSLVFGQSWAEQDGFYYLNNGYLGTSNVLLTYSWAMYPAGEGAPHSGHLIQSGGYHTNLNVTVQGGYDNSGPWNHTGNWIAPSFQLSGGTFASGTFTSSIGLIEQTGGDWQVKSLLLTNGTHCSLTGGTLTAQNLQLTGGTILHHGGDASFSVPGVVTLDGSTWEEDAANLQLGKMQLGANGDSAILFSANPCKLQFVSSASVPWAKSGTLRIQNWLGSLSGGGQQQIIFGNSASALTRQQLAQIHFYNPAGLAAGTYPATILSNGEIVPDSDPTNEGPGISFTNAVGPTPSMPTNAGNMTVQGNIVFEKGGGGEVYPATYNFTNGMLTVNHLFISIATFNQSGGTNLVNLMTFDSGFSKYYNLSDGWLYADTVLLNTVDSYFNQYGGTNVVNNLTLAYSPIIYGGWPYYTLSGGLLIATNVSISETEFLHLGGNCWIPGTLTMGNAGWSEQASGAQIAQLNVEGTATIWLPAGNCVMQFGDSHGVSWATNGTLVIENWSGFQSGNGPHQIFFGTNASGLTSQQLSQVRFVNPIDFASGTYNATILADGEVIPVPAPFFTGEAALGGDWFYLSQSNSVFGYYYMASFPYIYHADMGWEYFQDAADGHQGAYFYDFDDGAWFYTEPSFFPFLYDFNVNAWMYYDPLQGAAGHYTSNPRWFYNVSSNAWSNHL